MTPGRSEIERGIDLRETEEVDYNDALIPRPLLGFLFDKNFARQSRWILESSSKCDKHILFFDK